MALSHELTFFLAIILTLAMLSVLIIVHEFGHFSVARFFGFQTPVFGFGLPFGPSWTLGEKWGTQFKIHACLLGGYVAIPELGDESNATQEIYGVPLKPFRKFPIWQRALVAVAGVTFNVLFAYLVMLAMLISLGLPAQNVVVYSLPESNPIARNAGVELGDRILAVDETKMGSPEEIVQYLGKRKSTAVCLHIFRPERAETAPATDQESKPSDKTDSTTTTLEEDAPAAAPADNAAEAAKSPDKMPKGQYLDINLTTNPNGKVGMALITKGTTSYKKVEGNFFETAGLAANKLWTLSCNMLEAMGMMVQDIGTNIGQKITGTQPPQHTASGRAQFNLDDLHGVLYVIKIGADIIQQDWTQIFTFTILISLDLAIVNLLPWPALDGGHLAFMCLEALRGKPLEEKAQGEIVKWGFVSLLVLMAVIMVNDVRGIIAGEASLKGKPKHNTPAPPP